MKPLSKNYILFILVIFCSGLFASNYNEYNLSSKHLVEVNKEWKNFQTSSTHEFMQFDSEIDRIQFHLNTVVGLLKGKVSDELSNEQLNNRNCLLNDLMEYTNSKIFPTNLHHQSRTPYFIDDFGVYCAVGYLISVSGNDLLAKKIKDEFNYNYIADIKTAGVKEWAQKHGFTLNELALIQPGYMPNTEYEPVGSGTNGPVNLIEYGGYTYGLIIAGNFDTLDNLPCLNLGYYNENQLNCLGAGLAGVVNDVIEYSNDIFVAGAITDATGTFPMAKYSDEVWENFQIPGRANAIGYEVLNTGWEIQELTISHESIPGKQEVWIHNDVGWQKQITVYGVIYDMEQGYDINFYAGAFDSAIVHRGFLGDTTILTNNVLIKDFITDDYYSVGPEISDTVHVIKIIGSAVYFGGACSSNIGRSEVCITRYLSGVLQSIVLNSSFADSDNIIYDLDLHQETDLIFGGEFEISPDLGTFGNNIALYGLIYNYIEVLGSLNGNVLTIGENEGETFIGGSFTSDYSADYLPYIARLIQFNAIDEEVSNNELIIFPNPANSVLNIETQEGITISNLRVFDILGNTVANLTEGNSGLSIDVSTFSNGCYFILAESSDGNFYKASFEKQN